ncbi:hypothetical protein V6N13_083666 [Hibiscus sabdariffa]|uniref:Large ribosomal subunit protein bL12 C-terminal domain-containing protein n=1 Tax=Hibiscus sabdariffa TaxID=183260 RepID=A0ABR2SZB9_9ROSI
MASIPAKSLLKHLISSSPKPPVSRFFSTAENRTQKIERIADELLDLMKLEPHDYSILIRRKLGIKRYAAGAFDIKLEKYEAGAKIKIIKEVRAFTELGLKEAKELVEKVPVVVIKGVAKEDAQGIIKKLQELGATAVLE